MIDALTRLWRLVSPHHRRIVKKRRLEQRLLESGVLRDYRTADRKRAAQIANLAFPHPTRKDNP